MSDLESEQERLLDRELALALEALEREERPRALDHLLVAWRASRSPRVADLVERLSDEIGRGLPSIEGKTRRAFQEQWLDLAGRQRSVDIGRLLQGLLSPPCSHVAERIERLASRPADPRLASALGAMVSQCPCTSAPNRSMWTNVFRVLSDLADPRLGRLLEQVLAERMDPGVFYDLLRARSESLLAQLSVPPPDPTPAQSSQLERIAARVGQLLQGPPAGEDRLLAPAPPRAAPTSEAELVQMILEEPADDGRRLVYADWLLERGDPRGELISLQFKRRDQGLTGNEARRERVLLKQHGREWLGELEPVIERKGVELERGFLSACRVRFRTARQRRELGDHPLWATVERLAVPSDPTFLLSTRLVSLRVVEELSPQTFVALADSDRALPWGEVAIQTTESLSREQRAAIAAPRALPRLARLRLALPNIVGPEPRQLDDAGPEGWRWLLEGRVGRSLQSLSVQERVQLSAFGWQSAVVSRPPLAAWVEAAARLPALRRLHFDVLLWWELTLTREADGWSLTVHWPNPHLPNSMAEIHRALAGLSGGVRQIRFEMPRVALERTSLSGLEELTRGFPAVELVGKGRR